MTGSVIFQSARIPAVIASVALGAMALPVLFTGVNGGLDCERAAAALAAPSAAAPRPATGPEDASTAAAPSVGGVAVARSAVEKLPLLMQGAGRTFPWVAGDPAAFAPRDAIKTEDGATADPPSVAARGRDAASAEAVAAKRLRSAAPKVVARTPPDGIGSERFRRGEPRRSEASGAPSPMQDERSSQSLGNPAAGDGSDGGETYADGGFTPND